MSERRAGCPRPLCITTGVCQEPMACDAPPRLPQSFYADPKDQPPAPEAPPFPKHDWWRAQLAEVTRLANELVDFQRRCVEARTVEKMDEVLAEWRPKLAAAEVALEQVSRAVGEVVFAQNTDEAISPSVLYLSCVALDVRLLRIGVLGALMPYALNAEAAAEYEEHRKSARGRTSSLMQQIAAPKKGQA